MSDELLAEIVARFPGRLRELRERASLSQIDLAKKACVPQSTLAAYEVGRNAPSWERVVRLSTALGVSPDAFLAVPNSKQNST